MEALERQVLELEALLAVYPREDNHGLLLTEEEQAALLLAREVVDAASSSGSGGRGPAPPHPQPQPHAAGADLDALPLLSGTVRPPDLQWAGQPVALRFVLPRRYPLACGPAPLLRPANGPAEGGGGRNEGVERGTGGPPGQQQRQQLPPADSFAAATAPAVAGVHHCAQLAVECSAPRHVHQALGAAVRAVAELEAAAGGGECLLLALEALREAVAEAGTCVQRGVGAEAAAAAACCGESAPDRPACALSDGAAGVADGCSGISGDGTPNGSGEGGGGSGLLCVLVWLHHLKSLTKRKLLVQWARELDLAGAVKPGFPGVVVVEGAAPDVREFLARMRALSWQVCVCVCVCW
ncbi:hypothetical protein HYH02_014580 [Chlamydomonas schloesseri]|uniref:Small nuclear ribonucleoprotein Prp3 C-terminal domain-containing protein n=1 Tax=Chlamydomonas schloesseri TaxID=2026947 RepID=A0A835SSM4_9CHLO|nr:hypothetical protein HYH02_014580 [Chlamydomonas schloesseri]|eukprot:KAG2427534.1 hypothetical protein HYH02_014580 [Chlamydomonas schloesseri]